MLVVKDATYNTYNNVGVGSHISCICVIHCLLVCNLYVLFIIFKIKYIIMYNVYNYVYIQKYITRSHLDRGIDRPEIRIKIDKICCERKS